MKVVIFAGGKGLRLSEETQGIPKPMVDIEGKPLVVRLMEFFHTKGYSEFLVCTGYRKEVIEDYFVTNSFPWKVQCIDTGDPDKVGTAGRLLGIRSYLDGTFIATYGDALCDVDLNQLFESHKKALSCVTITTVHPRIPFGIISVDDRGKVTAFDEKPDNTTLWSNGGFFVMEPQVFDFIENESEMLEKEPMQRMVEAGTVNAYFHHGRRYPVDTPKDLEVVRDASRRGEFNWK